ncbi:MAG: hypothetical protein AAGF02_04920 [Actinomycetota bacterium]
MRRILLSAVVLLALVAGAVTASADDGVVEVGEAVLLPDEVVFVRDVASNDELHAVLWSSGVGGWTVTLTAADGGELTRPLTLFEDGEAFAFDRDLAVGVSGVVVARVSDGVLGLQHVAVDGTVSTPVRNLAGDDAIVTEVEVEPFHDRFLVTWVEADATDAAFMRVLSRTYGADGSLGPVRPLSEITPGDSVGALRTSWHPGREEALALWFEGTDGAMAPVRSRRLVDETIMTRELPPNGLGMVASATGQRWNVRVLLSVHGPDEWLIEARTTECGTDPCTFRNSALTFATAGDLLGPTFDGGRPNRPTWESTELIGSVEGPTLLIEQESFPADGPASIRYLAPGSTTFEVLPETIPLGRRFGVFEISAFDGRYRLVLQETILVEPIFVDLTFPEPTTPSTTPTTPTTPTPSTTPPAPTPVEPDPTGYWMVDGVGNVYPFGAAVDAGGIVQPADLGGAEIVDIEPTSSGDGYWVLLSDQQVRTFGDAVALHSGSELAPGESATSMSADPDGDGYWIFTDRGRALAYGTAAHHGDMTGVPLNGPVIGSIATPTGDGYYMVASDGGIFAFGDAEFFGSMGGVPLNGPVVGLAPTPSGDGYWLVATDGGIFAFGDAPFLGSMGSTPLNRPVNGMVAYGGGYLMVASDGGIFVFGPADFHGSLGAAPPPDPVVAVAAIGE